VQDQNDNTLLTTITSLCLLYYLH